MIELLEEFEKAYKIYSTTKGKESLEVAKLFEAIGKAYKDQGKYVEAQNVFKRALDIKVKMYGDQHIEVAIDYHNMGQTLFSQGNLPGG